MSTRSTWVDVWLAVRPIANTNKSEMNWEYLNSELANAGRAYIYERAFWKDKMLDDYRGHFPMQQIFLVPAPAALLVEQIRPVPGQFQAGPLTLEQEQEEFFKQLDHFTYTASNCEVWRHRDVFMVHASLGHHRCYNAWPVATSCPVVAVPHGYLSRGFRLPGAPRLRRWQLDAPLATPVEIQARQHALHMHTDQSDADKMKGCPRYYMTEWQGDVHPCRSC